MICKKHVFKTKIFNEYDIRGEFQRNLTEIDSYFIGCSLGTYLKNIGITSKICVGYDGRKSSPLLKLHLIEGLLDVECHVVNLGLIITPILYYACNTMHNAYCGIMITASHNPTDYNGFKIIINKQQLSGQNLKKIYDIAKNGRIILSNKRGVLEKNNIINNYIDKIINPHTHFSPNKLNNKIKIAWDSCNASVAKIVKNLIKKLPGEYILVHDNIKYRYIDPTNEHNLTKLKYTIKKYNCDLGIAFDGDADRIVIIDNNLKIYYGDELLLIYTRDLLQRHSVPKIIVDIKASKTIIDELKKFGSQVILWKTGHSNIKNKMKKTKALLAGEVSGHLFFKENYFGFDDGLFAAAKFIYLFSNKNSVCNLRNIPKIYISPEIRIILNKEHKLILNRIKKLLTAQNIKYINIDGIRVKNQKGWWLVRCSNTEEKLTIRFEGYSQKNFNFILITLSNILRSVGLDNVLI